LVITKNLFKIDNTYKKDNYFKRNIDNSIKHTFMYISIDFTKKISILLLFSGLIVFPKIGSSQSGENFFIKPYIGNIQSYHLGSINKITFMNSNLMIHFNNGTIQNWGTSLIDYYFYQSSTSSVSVNKVAEIQLQLYPNPTNKLIHLSGIFNTNDSHVKLAVYDKLGRLAICEKLISTSGLIDANLDLSEFDSGLYFFNFTTSNGQIITKKIIKND